MGICRYCNQNAGFLRKQHGQCRDLHSQGIREMTDIAAQAAGTTGFNETALRNTLQAIASRARATEDDVSQAIADGWVQGVSPALSDGTLTHEEEDSLRTFRERLVTGDLPAIAQGSATLDRATRARITTQGRRAALSTGDGGAALQELDNAIRRAMMSTTNRRQLLIRAWEEAVEGAIEDGIVTLDEENALSQYLDRFGLTAADVNTGGTHTSLVQAAVIRDVTMGIIPHRQNIQGRGPFNLMKSETLVWVIDGVDYLETVTRRERRGTSHGVSVRVAKGLYYRPSTLETGPSCNAVAAAGLLIGLPRPSPRRSAAPANPSVKRFCVPTSRYKTPLPPSLTAYRGSGLVWNNHKCNRESDNVRSPVPYRKRSVGCVMS